MAYAWSSKTASTSHPPTPTELSPASSTATTPAASPAPSDSTGNCSDEENNEIKEIHEDTYLHLPDIHIFSNDPITEDPDDNDGYHTDDILEELEDSELEESLERQKEGETEEVMMGPKVTMHI